MKLAIVATASALTGLLVVGVLAPAAWGADARGSLVKLFDAGAKSTPAAAAAAKAQYEQLKKVDAKDRRVDYAYAVVLVNQHKYHDALPILSRYLEKHPGDPGVRAVMMWAQIQDKQAREVADQAVALANCFPQAAEGEPEDRLMEAARFLGTCFGYRELARPGLGDVEVRMERKNQVLARLGNLYTPAFDEGRDAVAKEVASLKSERDGEQKQMSAAAEVRQEQSKAAFDNEKKKIAERQTAVQTSQQELSEAQRELNVLQTQLASMQTDRSKVGAKIVVIQGQMGQLQSDYLNGLANPNFGVNLSLTAQAQIRAYVLALAALNKQALEMDRKIAGLQARAAETTGTGSKEVKDLQENRAAIRDAEKRAKIAEKQLRKPVPTSNARVAAINAKIANFATYAPFPYEREKERVLSWFAK